MSLSPKLDGDVTKIEGTMLATALAEDSFVGFYALTPKDGTYVRGARTWITAQGAALARINGAQLVEVEESFISTFDRLDAAGEEPTLDQVIAASTKGNPASWDTQQSK